MLLISCPCCGERDQAEFAWGGEAHIERPRDPDALSDAEWADFVFMRTNTKGVSAELWNHAGGCRKWFNVLRNTATDELLAVYRIGERPAQVNVQALPTPAGEPEIGSGNEACRVEQAADADTGS